MQLLHISWMLQRTPAESEASTDDIYPGLFVTSQEINTHPNNTYKHNTDMPRAAYENLLFTQLRFRHGWCDWFHTCSGCCQPVLHGNFSLSPASIYPSQLNEVEIVAVNEGYNLETNKQTKTMFTSMSSSPHQRRTSFGAMVATKKKSVRLWVTLRQVKDTRNDCNANLKTFFYVCVRFWVKRDLIQVHQGSRSGSNEPLWAGNQLEVHTSQICWQTTVHKWMWSGRKEFTHHCCFGATLPGLM